MSNHKYGFRNEIRYENQKAKEERAKKDLKRNIYGLDFSAIVFFIVLLVTLNGVQINQNLTMLLMVAIVWRMSLLVLKRLVHA